MRYHLRLVKMAIKKAINKKCWRGCGEKGTRLRCWWECKLVQPLWRTVWRLLKKQSHHMIHQSHSWAYMQKNCHSKRYTHSNIHCSTIYNSHHLEVTQMSTDRVMDKENVLYRINYILLNHKK